MPSENKYIEPLAKKAGAAVQDLVQQNAVQLFKAMDDKESDKGSLSIKLNLKREPGGIDLKTHLSFTSKQEDEREDYIDNPDQTRMNYND